ncbi:MAG TPA: extracellular solute-binding protein [Candidatus Sulfotelmatobacter sp.]|nr:extracellular solute-binding protein [Candidatus Sulfotelmatobacter sp.]
MTAKKSMQRAMPRRELLRRGGLGALTWAAAPALVRRVARAEATEINVATVGGVITDGLRRIFGEPFTKETGIKVNFGSGTSLALAKLQASTNPAQWDIINLSGAEEQLAIRDKLIVPYDYSIVDSSRMPTGYREPYGVKYSAFMFAMAWDRRKIPDDKAPKTWAEFWDTKRYPGKRSLDANISDGSIMEAALLADGVALDKLYPLDVERALKSLERLGRPNIIWYNANQEPIQQMISGEVALSSAFHGRVVVANRSGAQLGFTPAYSAVSGNYMCVTPTSAHKKEAFQFLSFLLSNTTADVEYIKLTTYAMPNTETVPLLPKDIADILPTNPAYKDKVFFKDDSWWAANLEKTLQRFKEWQIG